MRTIDADKFKEDIMIRASHGVLTPGTALELIEMIDEMPTVIDISGVVSKICRK